MSKGKQTIPKPTILVKQKAEYKDLQALNCAYPHRKIIWIIQASFNNPLFFSGHTFMELVFKYLHSSNFFKHG